MDGWKCSVEGMEMSSFYQGKRLFVTGHTGFKGIWLCKYLSLLGANVTGYALSPATKEGECVFHRSGVSDSISSILGDVRDFEALKKAFDDCRPDIVIHLAAQPIVREGYRDPVGTYGINVMGTVHILECIRHSDSVRSFLDVTTDKVYWNNEWSWGYRETDRLDGYDPYSNSKSCSELVARCYRDSFLLERGIAVSTARAGNVIGGGDFSPDRIIPDCVRAALQGKAIQIRNPDSIRPYQHVIEALHAYLLICRMQYEDMEHAGNYNVGPDEDDCVTTEELANMFCKEWGENASFELAERKAEEAHEATFLRLDSSRMRMAFGWKPRWHITEAVRRTVEWSKSYRSGGNVANVMEEQIRAFMADGRK